VNHEIRARVGAAVALGRFDEVERLARDGLADAPDDEVLLASLAEALAEQDPDGSKAEATELMGRAVAAAPFDPWVRRTASITCSLLELWREGLEHAEEAVRLAPNDAFSHIVLAERLIAVASVQHWNTKQHLIRAAQHADLAIHLAPADGVTYLVAGRVRLALGDDVAARYYTDLGMGLDPQHPLGHQLRGVLAMRAGNIGDAGDHYIAAGRLDPTSSTNVDVLRSVGKLRPFALMVGCYFALAGIQGAFNSDSMVGAIPEILFVVALVVWMLWPRLTARRHLTPEAKQVLEIERRTRGPRTWPWSRRR
jgi:tetratricopeptide (TPR) repeat protein